MVRSACPSKDHFAKCITEVEGRPTKITWKCDHCNQHVISGDKFKPAYARIHLAAENTNGLCANLCTSKDDHAQGRRMQFRKLIKELEDKKKTTARKRKQQSMRLQQRLDTITKNKRAKMQPKLKDVLKVNDTAAADLSVGQWAFAHDIPANVLSGIYWKQVNSKLSQVCINIFICMHQYVLHCYLAFVPLGEPQLHTNESA